MSIGVCITYRRILTTSVLACILRGVYMGLALLAYLPHTVPSSQTLLRGGATPALPTRCYHHRDFLTGFQCPAGLPLPSTYGAITSDSLPEHLSPAETKELCIVKFIVATRQHCLWPAPAACPWGSAHSREGYDYASPFHLSSLLFFPPSSRIYSHLFCCC